MLLFFYVQFEVRLLDWWIVDITDASIFTQFLVPSTIPHHKFWLFRINTPHTSHLNGWLYLLQVSNVLNRTPTSHHVNLLQSPNLVLACSFIVSSLATIWTFNRWFLWIKNLTLLTKSFALWAPRLLLCYSRRPCHAIVFYIINARWKDVVFVHLLYVLKLVVWMHQIL